jgi:hypothetical protein
LLLLQLRPVPVCIWAICSPLLGNNSCWCSTMVTVAGQAGLASPRDVW